MRSEAGRRLGAAPLTSSTNPENGTLTYQYDAKGHTTQRLDAKDSAFLEDARNMKPLSSRSVNRVWSDDLQGQIPAWRLGTPTEIAQAVVFLASDEAGFTVGSELLIDGGMSL